MRFITKEVASLCQGFHTSARPASPRLLQRSFHQTSPANRPRQRTFFTSNTLLSKDNNNSNGAADLKSDRIEPVPTNKKKVSKRSNKASKNSLRDPFRRVVVKAAAPETQPEADSSTLVCAVCAAESFDMDKVVKLLGNHMFQNDPERTGFDTTDVLHTRVEGTRGDVFIFPSGTVVTWAMPAEKAQAYATTLLKEAATNPHIDRTEEEELEFTTDASRETSAVRGEVVVLGTSKEIEGDRFDTTLAKTAFSAGLARSTKVAYLETSLVSYFESTRHISTILAQGTSQGLSKQYILQKTGELLNLRAQLNHFSELTDALPDVFWDHKPLENYYNQVCKSLDVDERIKTLNQKMDYAQEISTVLREMSSEKHSTRLEVIIIVLIAVEVGFELRRWLKEGETEDVEEKAAVKAEAA